jgi:hypothetical protein
VIKKYFFFFIKTESFISISVCSFPLYRLKVVRFSEASFDDLGTRCLFYPSTTKFLDIGRTIPQLILIVIVPKKTYRSFKEFMIDELFHENMLIFSSEYI